MVTALLPLGTSARARLEGMRRRTGFGVAGHCRGASPNKPGPRGRWWSLGGSGDLARYWITLNEGPYAWCFGVSSAYYRNGRFALPATADLPARRITAVCTTCLLATGCSASRRIRTAGGRGNLKGGGIPVQPPPGDVVAPRPTAGRRRRRVRPNTWGGRTSLPRSDRHGRRLFPPKRNRERSCATGASWLPGARGAPPHSRGRSDLYGWSTY